MSENREINKALEEMKNKIIQNGKAPVLFIGSGLSRRYYGTPDWKGLLEQIAKEVGANKNELEKWDDNEKMATELEYYCFAKDKPSYENGEDSRTPLRKVIQKIITEKNTVFDEKKNEVAALAKIVPTAIITTNYDEFLENTFGEDYNVFVGQDIIWSKEENNSKPIYKIHGSIKEPSTIVITHEDYDNFMKSSRYLYAKLMTLFWENPIVFMGYGMGDNNVKNVLDTIFDVMTDEQKKDFEQRIWMLSYDPKNEEHFEKKTIDIGKNKVSMNTFCLDKSYSQFYDALSMATEDIQEKDLKFIISEHAIDLLIRPLYQSQDKFKVVVRELLQNAIDACKKTKSHQIKVAIDVSVDDGKAKLKVSDCGTGMDFNDITKYFLTIGESSKTNDHNNCLTGKFGIGILSIFLIGKEAKVYSKKESSSPVGVRIFQEDNEKKVEKIEKNNVILENGIATTLEIDIDDEKIVQQLKEIENNSSDKIGNIMKCIGLDNYCVWDDSKIKVTFNGLEKNIEKLSKDNMNTINNDLYIAKIYVEDEKQNDSKRTPGTALINDMITKVKFGTEVSDMIKNINIPFFAVRTDRFYKDNVKPSLSRNEVEIHGQLEATIISYIYEEVAKEIMLETSNQIKVKRVSALDLKNNVILNCEMLKNQSVIYKKNKVVFPVNDGKEITHVYGSQEIFEKFTDEDKECDYCINDISKSKLGDLIMEDRIKGIGIEYLNRYIFSATSSYNGLRMYAVKKLFRKLNIGGGKTYKNSSLMWADIQNNVSVLKMECEEKQKNGIIWLDDEDKALCENIKSLNNALITEEYKECIDKQFADKLKNQLDSNPDVRNYLILE